MLEFVDSGLYFVQDENNFINPLLQVGSGSGSDEKLPDPDPHPWFLYTLFPLYTCTSLLSKEPLKKVY